MLNEKEEDEKGFEWINSNHPRIYATTAVAEQNSNTMFIPKEVFSQPWPNVYTQVNYGFLLITLSNACEYMNCVSRLILMKTIE